mgnify:CR=1 FL=1
MFSAEAMIAYPTFRDPFLALQEGLREASGVVNAVDRGHVLAPHPPHQSSTEGAARVATEVETVMPVNALEQEIDLDMLEIAFLACTPGRRRQLRHLGGYL